MFNFVYLAEHNDLLEHLISENVPFLCFPQRPLENSFDSIAQEYGLLTLDRVVAHVCNVSNFPESQNNSSIEIKTVATFQDLEQFDALSSICFDHPPTLAYKFLEKLLLAILPSL